MNHDNEHEHGHHHGHGGGQHGHGKGHAHGHGGHGDSHHGRCCDGDGPHGPGHGRCCDGNGPHGHGDHGHGHGHGGHGHGHGGHGCDGNGPHGHGHGHGHHGRGRGRRGQRRRAPRGTIAAALLALLDEEPRHGYDMISALNERSGGRWIPGPGSIYPTLRRLEEQGLVESTYTGGKQVYHLTMDGRQRVAEQREAGMDAPWDHHGLGNRGELRRAVHEIDGLARQIGHSGNADLSDSALARLHDAAKDLNRLLSDSVGEGDDVSEDDAPADD
ncbi:MAG: PadR family transcriptional regulator [Ilumatobacter coccineus]|uniref:PadR family transcriptional regulator n=1 Tax=Ilumatobacter coccineus TaxID=467094 RepID=A0A2G6KB82_9ACTN|nr:MAG: PadR family transcriptional regulator [Ilumatobacter coccineus]